MRPPITITNKGRNGKVQPGWFVQVGEGKGKRFTQEEWENSGIQYVNDMIRQHA